MKKFMLSTYLLFTIICSAQIDFVKHADLLVSAHRALEKNETKKALTLYEEAFTISNDNLIAEYLRAATCAAKLEDSATCKKWIVEAIEQKKVPRKSLLKFSDNTFYQNCVKSVLPNYNTYLSNFYKSIENPMVFFQIQELLNRDQETRKIDKYYFGISEKEQEKAFEAFAALKSPADSLLRKKYWAILYPKLDKANKTFQDKAMRYADSLNITQLIDITKEYGWQKEAHLLLWHQRGTYGQKNWVWDYFKPLIDKEIEKGNIKPSYWAMFEDITSIYKTGKSIYGYHPGKVDPKTVNIKRKSIGLPELTQQEIENRNTRRGGGRVF